MNNFKADSRENYTVVGFEADYKNISLTRKYNKSPFIPANKSERDDRCEEILSIQAMGLKKRLSHTHFLIKLKFA